MPKTIYRKVNFSRATQTLIGKCNSIITEYQNQGFTLTLRQLYYQLVSRDVIRNVQREYKRLGSIVNDARLAGKIDWLAIEDRTRNLRGLQHWRSPADILAGCAATYREDLWSGQPWRPEVWIEKDALIGVIEGICAGFDVPFFSCRGYVSQSEMWVASQRLARAEEDGQSPIILHLGDHDPSGKDITRDINDRMDLFVGGVEVRRLALNMDQVRLYTPPPNPAKTTDSRYAGYIAEFGTESWELDALEPAVITDLIRNALAPLIDAALWKKIELRIDRRRAALSALAGDWKFLGKRYGKKGGHDQGWK